MRMEKPAATVTTASGHLGSDNTIHPTQTRLLSPIECSLLQTFPSDFKWGDALTKFGHTHIREMIGEAVPPAFTRMHGQVLYGIVKREWERAPMTLSDERCVKAWAKLVIAAKKDDRVDPRSYFEHAMPKGREAASTKPIRASEATKKSTHGHEASQEAF